jgi:Spy/CpxP family protein refolding chaperone
MRSRKIHGFFAALLICACVSASAPAPVFAETEAAPSDDPFAKYLFPPERVMSHAIEIGLDDAQKTAIKNEAQKAQHRFLDLQFEMQGESEKLIRLLEEKQVNEASVLAEVDRVLGIEKEIKKAQISLLVRIKNVLTPAQQAKLSELPK